MSNLFEFAPLQFAPLMKMKVLPGDLISDSIALTGIYELPFSKWLVKVAKSEGGVLVDVGANLGYFSLLWCANKNSNHAVAFEASPRNVELLEHNVQSNRLTDRIQILANAVGKSSGVMHFDPGPIDQTGWGGLCFESSSTTIDVPIITLDSVLANLNEVAVLKVDIEGADTWALFGAERVLRERRVRHIWWEENKPRMRQLGIASGESQRFMNQLGYESLPQGDPEAEFVNWYARPKRGS